MKKLAAILLPLTIIGGMALAGCGKAGGNGTTSSAPKPVTSIGMNSSDFVDHNVAVKVNTPITLDDTISGGGVHILCFGTGNGGAGDGACSASGDGPSELYGKGMMINPGEKKTVTFSKTGTYHLICTVHGGMFVDITVQ